MNVKNVIPFIKKGIVGEGSLAGALKGKYLLLFCIPGVFTPTCHSELKLIQELEKEYEDLETDLVVLCPADDFELVTQYATTGSEAQEFAHPNGKKEMIPPLGNAWFFMSSNKNMEWSAITDIGHNRERHACVFYYGAKGYVMVACETIATEIGRAHDFHARMAENIRQYNSFLETGNLCIIEE
ncbi:MAG TPA: redoxin family protein [Chitinophagales bacterium]|nr:redoxin family protein [Chitinophagales bacterium]